MPAEKLQVHPDNYVQLKLVILKHLPILGQYHGHLTAHIGAGAKFSP